MKEKTIFQFIIYPVTVLPLLWLMFNRKDIILWLTREDFVIEILTVAFFIFIVLIGIKHLFREYKQRKKINWFICLYTLAAFFIAGEEISWGQRIFSLKTPAIMKQINTQGEITLHNIGKSGPLIEDLYISGLFVYFVILPIFALLNRKIKILFKKIGIFYPDIKFIIGYFFVMLPLLFSKMYYYYSGSLLFKGGYEHEIFEMLVAFLALHVFLVELRKEKV